ncbi:hypothetical protein SAMD00019534_053510, partial [Acytostelium subglobosum LB1]|uniref:hypothetical protein n=1 Tax=Acytostelium subglobosum LB1 TaxID=1410327 RepID=UPI0006449191
LSPTYLNNLTMKYTITHVLLLLGCMAAIGASMVENNPPSDPYEQQKAEDYLLFSYASYCDAKEIEDWSCKRCKSDFPHGSVDNPIVIFENSTDTQAFVATYNNTVFIAFRGSMDIENWITNLKFFQTAYPKVAGAEVHLGFYEAYMGVQSKVYDALTTTIKNCPTCTSIVVTGHSLGGALATLCMADVVEWFPEIPTESITFGSPRVGNDVFSTYYNSIQPNTWRVVNMKDIVPHVPPQGPLPEYHHVPNELWYKKHPTGPYIICNDSGEDKSCSDSTLVVERNIWDHLHYFDKLCCC